jgi:hypothetical protein
MPYINIIPKNVANNVKKTLASKHPAIAAANPTIYSVARVVKVLAFLSIKVNLSS